MGKDHDDSNHSHNNDNEKPKEKEQAFISIIIAVYKKSAGTNISTLNTLTPAHRTPIRQRCIDERIRIGLVSIQHNI